MTLGHWTEVMTTWKLFQIQWIPISHHTSQRKKIHIIHQDEKTWSHQSIIFLYTLSSLGIEEETVVEKELPGIGAGNDNDIEHVKNIVNNNVTM